MRLKPQHAIVAAVLVAATSSVISASAAPTSLKGLPCAIPGLSTTYKGYTYTCITVKATKTTKKKTVYNAGVKVAPPTTTTTKPSAPALPTNNFDTNPGTPIWQENFAGAAGTTPNTSIWTPVTGYGTYGTGEIENNTNAAANLSEDGNGNLQIIAQCVATGTPGCTASSQPMGQTWTSARIWTENNVYFQYGQLEARIWMPTGSFNWPAFWMMGKNYNSGQTNTGWPYCGELDIAEGLQGNKQDQATIHSNIPGSATDWAQGSGLTQVAPITGTQMTLGWHTYGVLWLPNSITFTLDGKAWARVSYDPKTTDITQTVGTQSATYGPGTAIGSIGGNWPFNQPFFIILNDAIGGVSSPIAPNGSSATMRINWVKYYKYQGQGTISGNVTPGVNVNN